MKVILPGSYDPVTVGHLDIIRRAAEEHDEVFAVVFNNDKKKYRFSVEDRVRMLTLATDGLDNVLVSYSSGLVIDYTQYVCYVKYYFTVLLLCVLTFTDSML